MNCFHTIRCKAVIIKAPSGHLTKSPEVFKSIRAIKEKESSVSSTHLHDEGKYMFEIHFVSSGCIVLLYINYIEGLTPIEKGVKAGPLF